MAEFTLDNTKNGLVLKAAGGKIPVWIKATIPDTYKLTISVYPCYLAEQNWIEKQDLSSASSMTLSLKPVTKIEQLYIDDTLLDETEYTLDYVNGIVTFTSAQTGTATVYYKAIPNIDTSTMYSEEIAGDDTEKRKTLVFDLSGIPYVAFVFTTDSTTEFTVQTY